jgi:hypothetical protein
MRPLKHYKSINNMSEISNVLKSVLHQALAFTPSFNQVSFVASFGIVFGIQKFVKTEGGDWYKKINKPTWTPPNWIFPVVCRNIAFGTDARSVVPSRQRSHSIHSFTNLTPQLPHPIPSLLHHNTYLYI